MSRRGILLLAVLLCLALQPQRAGAVPLKQASVPQIVAAFNPDSNIWITDFHSAPINITKGSNRYIEPHFAPVWSPDGTQIAFLSTDPSLSEPERFQVITLATGKIRDLSDKVFTDEAHLAWSPDSRYVAVTWSDLFLIDTTSGNTQQLTKDRHVEKPRWLPAGSRIAFEGEGEQCTIDPEGHNLQCKPRDSFPVSMPHYLITEPQLMSPDGQHIAFAVAADDSSVTVPGGFDIYVARSDGSELRLLTGEGDDQLLGWLPDNRSIMYWKGEPGGADGLYYIVNIVDGSETPLNGFEKFCEGGCPSISIRP
jgi:Tol biopolymer transport system component